MILTNAFSLNMLESFPASIDVEEVSVDYVRGILEGNNFESAVGHADTAAVFSSVLGLPVPFNRVSLLLKNSSTLLVGQYVGPRLPEGTKELPEGATIKWLKVYL